MFNFINKHKKILTYGDIIPDTRLHVFMVTIPGYGKTYLIDQFMSKYNGLLTGTDIPVSRVGSLTSSGFVGSIKTTQDGNVVTNKGTLQRKANYILASDEFSNIVTSGKTSHSANLINDLLSALDTGQMNKDQSGGGLEYETFATVWGATQTKRVELKSGLIRRFAFVIYMPTVQDVFRLREIREETLNLVVDTKRILEYKLAVSARYQQVGTVLKKVIVDQEYRKWIKTKFAMHYEDMIFEKILLGYWIMKSENISELLELKLNDEVKGIIEQQIKATVDMQKGVQLIKIMDVVKEVRKIKYSEFVKLLLGFTYEYDHIKRSLDVLKANKLVVEKDDYIICNVE